MNSAEWWFTQCNIEAVACVLPTYEHVERGVHLVWAAGNDAMLVQATVFTEQAELDPDNSEVVQLVYLGRALRAVRMAEAAGRPVRG